jgi:hypothetical protein
MQTEMERSGVGRALIEKATEALHEMAKLNGKEIEHIEISWDEQSAMKLRHIFEEMKYTVSNTANGPK